VAFAVPDPTQFGAGPYGGDTPADEAPNTIKATTPGTDLPGADDLPAGTPQHAAAKAKSAATSGGSTTSPTSPGDSPTSSDKDESAGDADSGSAGTSDSAEPTASKSTTRKR
jgi:hypothetical protein